MEGLLGVALCVVLLLIMTAPFWSGVYVWRLERKWRRDGTWEKLIEMKKGR